MALPTAGTRVLTHDGQRWRWLAKRAWVHAPDSGEAFIRHRLMVTSEADPGALLRVELDARTCFPDAAHRLKYADFLSVTPAVVTAVLRAALATGWPREPRTLHWPDGGTL